MRILGGEFRGRRLRVPRGGQTRPSTGRLREALFSVLGSRLGQARVVDLFSGSGSLGLEALSRGASWVLFVENDTSALRALGANIDTLGVASSCEVRRQDANRWLEAQRRDPGRAWDLVMADPPYGEEESLALLSMGRSLVECGRVGSFCLEHAAALRMVPEPSTQCREQTRRYGQSAFTLVEGAVP